MSREKRKHPRREFFRVCRYIIQGREYADLSVNLSERGIFIKNTEPPPVGTEITLIVQLPREGWANLPLKITGQVVRVNRDPDPHRRGMGIQFKSVTAEEVPLIEYFVREVYKQESLNTAKLRHKSQPENWEYDLEIDVELPE